MWTTNSRMLGSSTPFPRVGMRKQNRTYYHTKRFISKDRLTGQYGNFMAPYLCESSVVYICPLSRGKTSKSMSPLEGRTLSPKKDTIFPESRDREKWIIARPYSLAEPGKSCMSNGMATAASPLHTPDSCSLFCTLHEPTGTLKWFYTQVPYFTKEGQHEVGVKTWLCGQTDLSLKPSRATDKPDGMGTLKNFLSFSVHLL